MRRSTSSPSMACATWPTWRSAPWTACRFAAPSGADLTPLALDESGRIVLTTRQRPRLGRNKTMRVALAVLATTLAAADMALAADETINPDAQLAWVSAPTAAQVAAAYPTAAKAA